MTIYKFSNNNMFRKLTLILILLSLTVWGPQIGVAQPLSPQERQAVENINIVFRRAIEQVRPAVVNIQVRKSENPDALFHNRSEGEGSGCIIDPAGYIITNNHVVADMEHVEIVLADHRRFQAVEVFLDPDTDLAIVQIDPQGQELPYAQFGDSDQALVGDFVMAMGSPFGLEQTVTMGIISFKGRQTHILDKWGFEDFIQTDADINRGNSGGPLVNLYGEVVGINSNIFSPTGTSTGYGFSIPSNVVKQIAQQLIAEKKIKRGYLGVTMSGLNEIRDSISRRKEMSLPPQATEELNTIKDFLKTLPDNLKGVLISEVLEETPAQEAGIKKNDLVLSINDHNVTKGSDLRNFIAARKPNETVTCEIWREGKIIQLNVKLGDRDVAKQVDKLKDAKEKEEYYARHPRPSMPFGFKHPIIPDQWPETDKAKLGVYVQTLTPQLAQQFGYEDGTNGVIIKEVHKNSLAYQSGLEIGDIIVSIDQIPILSAQQLKEIVTNADLTNKGITLKIRNLLGERTHVIKQGAD